MNKFYTYHQNNSGGHYFGPCYVIIEALSPAEADTIAECHNDSPIYFNGVSEGRDCPCCGDRWYTMWEDGTDEPKIYGKPASEYENVLIIRKEKND